MVNDVTGVAGLIKPGDYVDVIITLAPDKEDIVASMIFQNVLILATDKNINHASKDNGKTKDDKTTTLTVAVTADDATKLALAEAKGKVMFALRPYSAFNSPFTLVENKTMSSLGIAPVYHAPVNETPAMPTAYVAPVRAETAPPRIEREMDNSKRVEVVRGTQTQNVAVR